MPQANRPPVLHACARPRTSARPPRCNETARLSALPSLGAKLRRLLLRGPPRHAVRTSWCAPGRAAGRRAARPGHAPLRSGHSRPLPSVATQGPSAASLDPVARAPARGCAGSPCRAAPDHQVIATTSVCTAARAPSDGLDRVVRERGAAVTAMGCRTVASRQAVLHRAATDPVAVLPCAGRRAQALRLAIATPLHRWGLAAVMPPCSDCYPAVLPSKPQFAGHHH